MQERHSPITAPLRNRIFWVLYFFCFLVVFTRAVLIPVDDQQGGRTFWRGDDYSDKGAVSASRYWQDHGYWDNKLRPMHGYEGDKSTASAYLHYPPIADLVTSAYIKVLGFDLRLARLAPLVLSFLFVLVLAVLLQILFRDTRITLLSLALTLPTNYFLAWADSLYSHMLAEMCKVAFVAVMYFHYTRERQWQNILPLAGAAILFSNVSLHLIVYCAVVAVGFSICYRKSWRRIFAPENVILGIAFALGLALHVYLNRLYLGSWEATGEDIRSIFQVRGHLPWQEKLLVFWNGMNRIERYFMIPGWALIVFFICFLRATRPRVDLRILAWILLAAGLSWYVVMPQHSAVHTFMAREIGLFYLLVVGWGVQTYWHQLRLKWNEMAWYLKGLNILFVTYVVGMAISQQVITMWWRHGLGRWFS